MPNGVGEFSPLETVYLLHYHEGAALEQPRTVGRDNSWGGQGQLMQRRKDPALPSYVSGSRDPGTLW